MNKLFTSIGMRKYSIRVALFIESVLAFSLRGLLLKDVRLPTLFEIIIVLGAFLALVLSFTVFLDLPIQLALFVSWFIAMILGIRLGYSYKDLQNAIVHGISNGLEAVLILVSVGALIGTWIAGGVVPTLIYYGLEFIHPSIFYSQH